MEQVIQKLLNYEVGRKYNPLIMLTYLSKSDSDVKYKEDAGKLAIFCKTLAGKIYKLEVDMKTGEVLSRRLLQTSVNWDILSDVRRDYRNKQGVFK